MRNKVFLFVLGSHLILLSFEDTLQHKMFTSYPALSLMPLETKVDVEARQQKQPLQDVVCEKD